MSIYCAFDSLNGTFDKESNIIHACQKYGSAQCIKCNSRYDGEKIKEYMQNNPAIHSETKQKEGE